jgi:hypothetical protein
MSNPITFQDVFRAELKAIRGRDLGPGEDPIQAAHKEKDGLIGLALSGGGIRSATFNLGVIQALAERRLLRRFDYLSTVSGGGYIGSWLSALIQREGKGDVTRIEAAISPESKGAGAPDTRIEHPAIRFLRAYSNYLTPKVGLFSADTLAFGTTYLRNLTLNLLVLLCFLGAALLVPLLLAHLFLELSVAADFEFRLKWAGLVALGLALVSVFFISLNLSHLHHDDGRQFPWYTRQIYVVLLVALPLLASAVLFSRFMWNNEAIISAWSMLFATLYPMAWLIAHTIGRALAARPAGTTKPHGSPEQAATAPRPAVDRETSQRWLTIVPSALVAFAVGAGLLWLASTLFEFPGGEVLSHWHLATWGPPLVLLIFSFAVVLQIGLMGASFYEGGREWWSRLGAWLIIVVTCWSALFAISVYGEAVLVLTQQWVGDWLPKALASGWLISTVAGVLAGRSASTGGKGANPRTEIIAKVTPYVFVIGLLVLLASAIHFAIFQYLELKFGAGETQNLCSQWVARGDPISVSICVLQLGIDQAPVGAAFLLLFAVGLLLSWRVDINLFSMHMMYRNRLTRCYLGASNPDRQPEPFTGFDDDDDLPLSALAQPRLGSSTIQRPYHIVNAALNLVRGRQLAWQKRKAASFVFTPKYCGYLLTDPPKPNPPEVLDALRAGVYRPTFEFASGGGGMKLGAAFAISGAAASPNMGYHSSPPLAFLLTVFNVRLGKWCGNTVDRKTWRRKGPAWGGRYLFMELFGMTEERSPFVYLSDGGHFENMGLYELVRRRCRLIIACDCGADPKYTFDDLANAIRKCYTDFGIEIEIKVDKLRADRGKGEDTPHFAVGTIHYENVDNNGQPGTLLLLKPTLSGNEPHDVLSYADGHEEFPQQTTADQWFDEDQFESYRKLGYHVAIEISDIDMTPDLRPDVAR